MIPMTVLNIMDKRTDRMDISIVTPNPCKDSQEIISLKEYLDSRILHGGASFLSS